MSQLRRFGTFLLALAATAGCYDYRPLSAPQVASTVTVRATLTDRGMIDLAPLIGPQIEKVDGVITNVDDTAVIMRVSSVTNRVGYSNSWSGEAVTIPRGAIARLEQRSLNRKKSWLVGGSAVVATLVTGFAFSLVGDSSPGRGSNGGGGPR